MCKIYSLSIYEKSTHFYIIGADVTRTHYSMLKIDRTSEQDFIVGEPNHDYSRADIDELLATISSSSIITSADQWYRRGRNSAVNAGGLLRTVDNAHGILGVVRFLAGYYLLVATRARIVLRIGHHDIYKVEDVSMIYIPSQGPPVNPDEQKYTKLFQSVDLTTNFYFSHTYDISRTLQENALAQRQTDNHTGGERSPETKFVWNDFLLKPLRDNYVHPKWMLRIVHGYVGYNIIEIPCGKLLLALIARRSAVFAGTRFLKRGCNFDGAVANDVETEQLLWDTSSSADFRTGRFAAYVQRRGSVPLFWSQEPAGRGVVGKPPIYVDLVEPHALTTAAHFRELRRKYGHPIVVMNLIKRQEKRHNETILHEQFLKVQYTPDSYVVKYLNEFRRRGHCIDYIGFDVSRCHSQTGQVLQKLEQLGARVLLQQGWFQSIPELNARKRRAHWLMSAHRPRYSRDGTMLLQHGISRANCVDCLDRTNVAQFGIGKVALGFQLYAMGYTDEPLVALNSDVSKALEDLYDEHGDTLAWQYAGSQLVHSIKTYKRTAIFQERSRDVFQTISRYYSNTFSDYDKQEGINLFLGVFQPLIHARFTVATNGSDRYIHFPTTFHRRNEYFWWAINVGSDGDSDVEESEVRARLDRRDSVTKHHRRKSLIRLDLSDKRRSIGSGKDSCVVANDGGKEKQISKVAGIQQGLNELKLNCENLIIDHPLSENPDKDLKSDSGVVTPVMETSKNEHNSKETTAHQLHQKLAEMSMDDWMYMKAEEAGIPFDDVDQSASYDSKLNCRSCGPLLDSFSLAYSTFELTSFEQHLRDSPLAHRIVSVDSLSQRPFHTNAFMKLFKATDPLQRQPWTSQKTGPLPLPPWASGHISPTDAIDEAVEVTESDSKHSYAKKIGNIVMDEDLNHGEPPAHQLFQQIQHYQQLQQLYSAQQRPNSPSAPSASFYYYAPQYGDGSPTRHSPRLTGEEPTGIQRRQSTPASPVPPLPGGQRSGLLIPQAAATAAVSLKRKKLSVIQRPVDDYGIVEELARVPPRLCLSSGLRSTKDAYGFELKLTKKTDRRMYEQYAKIAERPCYDDQINNVKRALKKNYIPKSKESVTPYECIALSDLKPMPEFQRSFITVDSTFHTELNEMTKSELEVYRSRALELTGTIAYDAIRLEPKNHDVYMYKQNDLKCDLKMRF